MNFQDALRKADQILDEERQSPTVDYVPTESQPQRNSPQAQAIAELAGGLRGIRAVEKLYRSRNQRPREVSEDVQAYTFKSINYELLCALAAQVEEPHRPFFVSSLLSRIVAPPACGPAKTAAYPNWNGLSSELPLVAEFTVRNHCKSGLFRTVGEANPLPGHVLLLCQLEEMISVNFTAFTDNEYEQLELSVRNYARIVHDRYEKYRQRGGHTVGWGKHDQLTASAIFQELQSSAEAIVTQCRKARYLYLKGSLLEGLNLEVNQDKEVVQTYLIQLGFSSVLRESLDAAEQLYRSSTTKFEFKNCIGLLRSFLENLHGQVIHTLALKEGGTSPGNWGTGLALLTQKGLLTRGEESFASGLYKLMSDGAVHPLIAEREYARLARNVVIEYGLLLLRKLEKSGLQISPPLKASAISK